MALRCPVSASGRCRIAGRCLLVWPARPGPGICCLVMAVLTPAASCVTELRHRRRIGGVIPNSFS
jgi:hypothetical protein